jgi:16S rRNA (uracil1498-N3)-methyltransferase
VTSLRFFVPPSAITGQTVEFPAATSRQIVRVLRLRAGDELIALDNTGTEYVVRLTSVARDVTGTIVATRSNLADPSITLTLYQALLKGSKFETVIQKCTELGVSRFVPLVTERTVPGTPSAERAARFSEIAREATEQCGGGRVPIIAPPISLVDALTLATSIGPALFLWEGERTAGVDQVPECSLAKPLALFVGPEGGFSQLEAEEARAAGATVLSLGPRILRAETAAIVGAALVLSRTGAMRPIH